MSSANHDTPHCTIFLSLVTSLLGPKIFSSAGQTNSHIHIKQEAKV